MPRRRLDEYKGEFMLVIIKIERVHLIEYLNRYFDDSDNDNYARLIKNYPTLLVDFLERGTAKNFSPLKICLM